MLAAIFFMSPSIWFDDNLFLFLFIFSRPFQTLCDFDNKSTRIIWIFIFCNKLSVYLKRKLCFLHQVICFPILSLELSGVNSLRDSLSLRIVFRYDSLVVNMRLHHWIHQFYVQKLLFFFLLFVGFCLPFQRTNRDNVLDEHFLVSIAIHCQPMIYKQVPWQDHDFFYHMVHYIEVPVEKTKLFCSKFTSFSWRNRRKPQFTYSGQPFGCIFWIIFFCLFR